MDMQTTFHGVGLVWNILRRYCPEQITEGIAGMRSLASKNGAVFDVPEAKVQALEDIFTHAKESGKHLDFDIHRCESMPELFD
jgi:hypothetical protein